MGKTRQLQQPPSYCLHRPTGQGFATAPATAEKKRRPVYFGLWGTEHSLTAYAQFLTQLNFPAAVVAEARTEAQKRSQRPEQASVPLPANRTNYTIRQLWSEFHQWAKGYYRSATGEQTGEALNYAHAVRELLDLFGSELTADFSKKKLERVRQAMIDRQISRKVVNWRVNKIKNVFRWGTAEERELVPESVAAPLVLLRRLEPNRTPAKEYPPVRGVPPETVEKVAALCNPIVRAMLLLQLHTGMRPGEVRGLRKGMVQQIEGNWFADFGKEHKNGFRNQSRVVALGPKAMALLEDWLKKCPSESDYVFDPSQQNCNANKKRKKFHRCNYRNSLLWACRMAGVPHFAPNQIRHTAAEEIRKSDGLEAVQAVLGHKSRASSERYAPPVSSLATEIAKKRG